jgi:hypothetical protein
MPFMLASLWFGLTREPGEISKLVFSRHATGAVRTAREVRG